MLGYIEREFVVERKWMDAVEFHRIVAVAKLFPGPLASLVSARIGYARAGVLGGILAGLGQIIPAFLMIIALAQTVSTLDQFTSLAPLWRGMSFAAIAISLQATYKLTYPLFRGGSPYRPAILGAIIVTVAVLTFQFPRLEALFILSCGFLALAGEQWFNSNRNREVMSIGLFLMMFWTCFKASLFTFGSGIAIVPVLRAFFIEQHGWVSSDEFLRGLTLGQITPGPLVIVSTYLGFAVGNLAGALATTIGTFLPTFIFGIWLMPKFESVILDSPKLKSFFDGLMPAVCGAIFGAMARLLLFSVAPGDTFMWGRFVVTAVLTAIAIWRDSGPFLLFALGGAAAYLVS